MKAFVIDRYGGAVQQRVLPTPAVGATDVLIEVRAASVNPVDGKTRDGGLKTLIHYDFPLTLGCDVSGVVAHVGSAVKTFAVGDEVFARLEKDRIGAFAEQAVATERAVAKKPPNLSHVEAASIPLVGLTAWQALVELAQLQAGQSVLIHAGSGGVGTVAIQLAKHLGAAVTTTASARNAELVKRLGADRVVDYKREAFDAVLPEQDVVFDTQGGDTLLRSFAVTKRGGVVVTIGGVPDATFAKAWGLNPLLVLGLRFMTRKITARAREKAVRFEYLFMRPDGAALAQLGALYCNGTLKPVIDRAFSFAQTVEALAYVDSGRAVGKVVIDMKS